MVSHLAHSEAPGEAARREAELSAPAAAAAVGLQLGVARVADDEAAEADMHGEARTGRRASLPEERLAVGQRRRVMRVAGSFCVGTRGEAVVAHPVWFPNMLITFLRTFCWS